ncbi:unnamed protein product [Prorocentrum cordatum]|uniref:Metallo-beta-lactamase domain-containing protein n=1 Tax=Prorocentrum cordatum TaxID=2364126 RepID=A0ABN9VZW0_9DINO|nr:unnamed protein product [Polarella glacialis]
MMNHVFQGGCPRTEFSHRRCDGQAVCLEAMRPGSRNARCNVSILLRFVPPGGAREVVIMVDAGKTLRNACLKSFPKLGVRNLDVLLITHDHADAMMGLDDLRDLQQMEELKDPETGKSQGWRVAGAGATRIISNHQTLRTSRAAFPYLKGVPDFVAPGVTYRRVAQFRWEQLLSDRCALDLHGLPVQTFPVYHGGTYVSLGFSFGRVEGVGGAKGIRPFVYISDVSSLPLETEEWLREAPIGVLVVDALRREHHATHFSLQDAVDFVRKLRPRRALFVGMSSCETGDHDEVNAELAQLGSPEEGLDMQLAYDGLMLDPMRTAGPLPGDPNDCQLCEPEGY